MAEKSPKPRSRNQAAAAKLPAKSIEPARRDQPGLAARRAQDLQAADRREVPAIESGRSYEVSDANGEFVANAAQASRKDVRDAVVAARKAFPGWSGATAYNRGQVLYRVAELLEGRRSQFVDEVALGEGLSRAAAEEVVDAAIDRWVWYAGWSDKITQVAGQRQPGRRPVLQPLGAGADRRGGRARTAGVLAARPGVGDRAGHRHGQHRWWSWPASSVRCPP